MLEPLTQHGLWQSVSSQVYSKIPHLEASREGGGGQHSALLRPPDQGHLVSSHPSWLCVGAMECPGTCCVSILSALGSGVGG